MRGTRSEVLKCWGLFIVMVLIGFPVGAKEQLVITGDVYSLDGTQKLFNYFRYGEKHPQYTVQRNEFKDLEGNLILNERAVIDNGLLKKMTVDQPQTGESGSIEIIGTDINFIYKDASGKVEKKVEKLQGNFNVHMTIISFMQKHWKKLRQGKSLHVRMGVWYRADTIRFKIWEDSVTTTDDKKHYIVVMKPTNRLIRTIVDPVYFTFSAGGALLVSVKGRTTPKQRDQKGKWQPLDALIKFKNKLLIL